jgi:[histone H3]-lysine4/36 N-trimethyltransferase SMYD
VVERPGRGRCAVATRALSAGTVASAFSGKPYAAVPLPSLRERHCTACLRACVGTAKLLRCSRCRWTRYCSAACQKSDWALHKHECAALADGSSQLHQLSDAPLADVLLTGRCLWRRHDATTASSCGVEDAAFDQLETGVPCDSDRALGVLAAGVPGLLPPAASGAAASEGAAQLICAFGRNNFGVLNDLLSVVGAGCYPRAAILNHSCAPNCALAFNGHAVEVRTMRAVAAGDELCHSYVELCQPTAARRAALSARYGFVCDCARCVDGLRTATGEDIDVLMTALVDGSPNMGAGGCGELERSAELLAAAAQATNEPEELRLTLEALQVRRELCHPLSVARYMAEGRALTTALALDELETARACCRHVVTFLEAALGGVPAHPLLALQRFTLADLESACDEPAAALQAMEACAATLVLTAATHSPLRLQALDNLEAMRRRPVGIAERQHSTRTER